MTDNPETPRPGSPSPWGFIDEVEMMMAPGLIFATTPSHGGLYLAPERLEQMPEGERTADGWYEEDCEILWPMVRFAEDIGLPAERREAMQNTVATFYEGDFDRVRMRR